MKQTSDILDIIVPIINVTTITDLIGDGEIHRRKKPHNRRKKDIVINNLPIDGDAGDKDVQSCTFMVNCYAVNHANGLPDEQYLESITDAVEDQFANYAIGNTYFVYDIISENILEDASDEKMSFASIRFNSWIQKLE